MKISIRWLIGIVGLAALVCALCYPRWRLCSREIGYLADEEAMLRRVATRLEAEAEIARSNGDAKGSRELAEMAQKALRLADRRAVRQGDWVWARWLPFMPHPWKETESN